MSECGRQDRCGSPVLRFRLGFDAGGERVVGWSRHVPEDDKNHPPDAFAEAGEQDLAGSAVAFRSGPGAAGLQGRGRDNV